MVSTCDSSNTPSPGLLGIRPFRLSDETVAGQAGRTYNTATDMKKHPHNFIDLTGKRFSRLTVTGFHGQIKNRPYWNLKCDCGKETICERGNLVSGRMQSCGCLQKEIRAEVHTTHGGYKNGGVSGVSGALKSWKLMIARCTVKTNNRYPKYGGVGITVCERWMDFSVFLKDMGHRPPKHTIERKNNLIGYCPENCKWATQKEQQNNRTNNRRITIGEETKTIAQWADAFAISPNTIHSRIRIGWSHEKAITTPSRYALAAATGSKTI